MPQTTKNDDGVALLMCHSVRKCKDCFVIHSNSPMILIFSYKVAHQHYNQVLVHQVPGTPKIRCVGASGSLSAQKEKGCHVNTRNKSTGNRQSRWWCLLFFVPCRLMLVQVTTEVGAYAPGCLDLNLVVRRPQQLDQPGCKAFSFNHFLHRRVLQRKHLPEVH